VNLRDVRVIERGKSPRLPFEAGAEDGVLRQGRQQNLQRNVTIEPAIACAIDLAHAAGANRRDDFVRTDARPGRQRHGGRL
jgi:hypothetical protein